MEVNAMEVKTIERIAVLEASYADIKESLSNVRTDIKALSLTVDKVLAAKITDHTKIEMEVQNMQTEIKEIKGTRAFWQWFSPTISAALSSIITFLVINYFQHVH